MLNKVKQFIAEKHLLKADCLYRVALSGGADSGVLLLVLKELGYSIEAVHCNFHLRFILPISIQRSMLTCIR